MELILTARTILADEAERIGLVQKTVAADALMQEAREMARAMAECRAEVLTAAKRALRHGASVTMAEAMENERARSTELRQGRRDT